MFNAPLDTFSNRFKTIYVSRKTGVELDDYGNEIVTYSTPELYGKKNYQPMAWRDLREYISPFGETHNMVVQLLVDYKEKDKYKTFDLAYLYGATPEGELVNGDNANYVITSVREQNTKVMVLFEEIIKEGN